MFCYFSSFNTIATSEFWCPFLCAIVPQKGWVNSSLGGCSFVTPSPGPSAPLQLGWTSWLFNQTWTGWKWWSGAHIAATARLNRGLEIKPWHQLLCELLSCVTLNVFITSNIEIYLIFLSYVICRYAVSLVYLVPAVSSRWFVVMQKGFKALFLTPPKSRHR